jgi:hypothetical protein
MKRLSTLLAAGTLALALVTPALAGSSEFQGTDVVTQPDPVTLAELDQALDDAEQNETDQLQQQETTDELQEQQKALAAEMTLMNAYQPSRR